ncbi:cation diffusion facilitator 10 [Botrytis cinerea]
MTDDNTPSPSSAPKHAAKIGRYQGPSGWLSLGAESTSPIMATHGQGTLTKLIKNQSNGSLVTMRRQSGSILGRDSLDDEERPRSLFDDRDDLSERRLSSVLNGPQVRSLRLIGNSNPRYKWERYWKTEEELKGMKKPIAHNDIGRTAHTPETETPNSNGNGSGSVPKKIKRTPREIYKVTEETPLLLSEEDSEYDGPKPEIPGMEDDSVESGDRIVQIAIYINLAANTVLLAGKIAVIVLTSSLSVLASLVDAALDFLSTAIVFTTTKMIERQDHYSYPVGRRRLEPIGVLVFSVIMVTSFIQVALECSNRLSSDDRVIIELTLPAIVIMASTVFIKALCWLWCRLIKNSSVQALAQDAMTDVVFNIFSIIFPLVGFYAKLWWLDALGGLLLSLFVIINWAGTSVGHIRNLTGAAATADERNVLLYLTMRFARTIKQIQGLQAYHAGDKLNVEVDIVLDESMSLRDSHDLGESLQYVLESVPTVDRAFVHQDYAGWNLPTHMQQQGA